jgi:hypothetical protein
MGAFLPAWPDITSVEIGVAVGETLHHESAIVWRHHPIETESEQGDGVGRA